MEPLDPELVDVLGQLPGAADGELQENPVAALFRPPIPVDPTEAAALDSSFKKAVEGTRQRAFDPEARREAILQKNFTSDAPSRPALLSNEPGHEFESCSTMEELRKRRAVERAGWNAAAREVFGDSYFHQADA